MRGERRRKVLSTPIPWAAVRRTVKLALLPPRRNRMTIPRNSWTRSRPPSVMRRWTLTASPGLSWGTLELMGASTTLFGSVMAIILVSSTDDRPPFLAGRLGGQQYTTPRAGASRESSSDSEAQRPTVEQQEQPNNRLGVSQLPASRESLRFLLCHENRLDLLVLIGRQGRQRQVFRQVEVHVLGGIARNKPTLANQRQKPGRHPHFLPALPLRTGLRILPGIQCPRRQLQQLTFRGVPVLAHKPDPASPVDGDDRHGGRGGDDIQLRLFPVGQT